MAEAAHQYIPGNVFIELGLANLSEERKKTLLEKMNKLVHKRTMLRIIELLPEEVKKDLDSIQNLSDAQQVEKLLQSVPNLAGILMEEIEKVKIAMKAAAIE